ncbi:hypothetical protein CRENBAI_011258 [Crenichthys baileyi]|uniref:Uncharacterized protein n=1 Tax=Crenichthys baileyi TaxID=28760 RepID=A0AAV9QVD3_9TELE
MEDSPPRLVQSLLTGCSNQRQVHTPPRPIISQGITLKDLLHGRHRSSAELRRSAATCPTSFWQLGCSLLQACGKRLKNSSNPPTNLAEVALPSPRLPPPHHPARLLQWFSSDLVPQTDLPAPQAATSFSTPLLQEFASNSATSAFPLLRSANVQPVPWPLPLTFTIATLVLARP